MVSQKGYFVAYLCLSFPSTISVMVDGVSTYYILLAIAQCVGFVTIELYPIHGVPSTLDFAGVALPTE